MPGRRVRRLPVQADPGRLRSRRRSPESSARPGRLTGARRSRSPRRSPGLRPRCGAAKGLAGDEELFARDPGHVPRRGPPAPGRGPARGEGGDAPTLEAAGPHPGRGGGPFRGPGARRRRPEARGDRQVGRAGRRRKRRQGMWRAFDRFRRAVDASRLRAESPGLAPA